MTPRIAAGPPGGRYRWVALARHLIGRTGAPYGAGDRHTGVRGCAGGATERRWSMERDLRAAPVPDQFHLEYQPIINLRTWQVDTFEALMRWTHPVQGPVAPDAFMPVAERIGVLDTLSEWVLREACAEAAGWPHGAGIAVNLSPRQFRSERLVAVVKAVLAAAALSPHRLELEITEHATLQDDAVTHAVLQQLGDYGVRIAMDDFGTGYSSLGALYRFPFHAVKLDRSFAHDLATWPAALTILRAVTQLGADLRIRTTIEGIETQQELARVVAEGGDYAQGYLFSRPLRPAQIPGFLRDWRARAAVLASLHQRS